VQPFEYVVAVDVPTALSAIRDGARPIAGGTNLLDLMKLHVELPNRLVDINALPLKDVETTQTGLRIGALVRNSDLAFDSRIKEKFPVLAEALLAGASPQLRNMATVGGNLMQRTRCAYFRDATQPCNKRVPGSGCSAIGGYTRMHAILGTSSTCIATNPSDMVVALVALDATVIVQSVSGSRSIPITDFHRDPSTRPEVDTTLLPGELIVAVEIPQRPMSARSRYLKVRDRASYAFALASAAVALDLEHGRVRDARIAFGGVGTKPWRSHEAESALKGRPADEVRFKAAADVALRGAKPEAGNAFKVELAKRALVRALHLVATGA
jgi:xanthine dehydrogenase YagS FAD-binding subunit